MGSASRKSRCTTTHLVPLSGLLVEAVQFPKLVETFYAVTLARRFPNRLLKDLLRAAAV